MRRILLVFCLFAGNFFISAQTDFQSIINSEIVKDKLTFQIIGDSLNMSMDNGEPKEMVKELSLQGKSKQIVINTKFIHPLKYQVSLENKLVDDELSKAAQEYLSQFTGYVSAFSKSDVEGLVDTNVKIDSSVTTPDYIIKNPHLIELYALLTGYDEGFFDSGTSIDPLLIAMVAVKDKDIEGEIIAEYENIFTNIWEIESFESIKEALDTNKGILKSIEEKIKLITASTAKLKDETSTFKSTYLSKVSMDIRKNIINLIKDKIEVIEKDHEVFLKKKEELDLKYKAFAVLLNKIAKSSYGKDGEKETRIERIIFENKKRNVLTVYFKKFEYNKKTKALTEKDKKSYTIYLRKFQTFIPVISGGVLYTNVTFDTYGTETNDADDMLLTQGKSEENKFTIAAHLNLYINNGWNNPLFLQFGVGPSKEKPLIFGGLGMQLGAKFSLSAGAVFTWAPTLDELSVGDVVTGTTQINDDIIYKFTSSPKFYLGLSFDLTK